MSSELAAGEAEESSKCVEKISSHKIGWTIRATFPAVQPYQFALHHVISQCLGRHGQGPPKNATEGGQVGMRSMFCSGLKKSLGCLSGMAERNRFP